MCLTPNQEVKARKERKCDHCREVISKGEIYITRSGVEPGEGFWRYSVHPECDAATKDWNCDDWENSCGIVFIRGTDEEK